MSVELVLVLWTAGGLAWWLLAGWLVVGDKIQPQAGGPDSAWARLTIFKPLPPQGDVLRHQQALETFISQLDTTSELLLGLHEPDRALAQPFLQAMREKYPEATLKIIHRDEPDSTANPKIAWLKILAPHATGELWLWSDADVIAPSGFLRVSRADFARAGLAMITFPYLVSAVPEPPALPDALYVNAEFYPGVLLLRKFGPVDFGMGAGMLFSRAAFEQRASWEELGSHLADDFVLGRRLRPVGLGRARLATEPDSTRWLPAWSHHVRWAKTVRWYRPGGQLAKILVLPGLGWMAWVILHPARPAAWAGLGVTFEMEAVAGWLICRAADCRLRARDLFWLQGWGCSRVVVWLFCWLPGAVRWRARRWRGPTHSHSPRVDKVV